MTTRREFERDWPARRMPLAAFMAVAVGLVQWDGSVRNYMRIRRMDRTAPQHNDPEAAARIKAERARRKAENYRKRYNLPNPSDLRNES